MLHPYFLCDDARYTALERRVQEEADAAVVIAQDIIGAAADDDAVAASGEIADDFVWAPKMTSFGASSLLE